MNMSLPFVERITPQGILAVLIRNPKAWVKTAMIAQRVALTVKTANANLRRLYDEGYVDRRDGTPYGYEWRLK